MGERLIGDHGIAVNDGACRGNQLVKDYLKMARSKMTKRKTPLLEFEYAEGRTGGKATAGNGSQTTLAGLQHGKLNKRELKALQKENQGHLHFQAFP